VKVIAILFICLVTLFVQSGSVMAEGRNVSIPDKEADQIKTSIENIFEGAWRDGNGAHFPSKRYGDIYDLLFINYENGYMTQGQFDSYIAQFGRLVANTKDDEGDNAPNWVMKNRWKSLYKDFANSIVNHMKSHPGQPCVEEDDSDPVASNKQCCQGYEKLNFVLYSQSSHFTNLAANKKKATGESCLGHSECYSKVCNKITPANAAEKGYCAPIFACYKRIPVSNECYDNKPYCAMSGDSPTTCIDVNYESSGIGECKHDNKVCETDLDCCSSKCSAGSGGAKKCEAKKQCLLCANLGEKPDDTKKECCPGLYKSQKGSCIPDFPPLILDVSIDKKLIKSNRITIEKVASKIFSFFISSAHAVGNDDPNCVDGVNCGELNNEITQGMTQAQIDELNKQKTEDLERISTTTKNCYAEGQTQDKLKKCLQSVADMQRDYNSKYGVNTNSYDREQYKDVYNYPAITSKTYSKPKECKFNTFNDHWKDAPDVEMNSELFMRGFEYVYSGKGAKDYWHDDEGRAMFSRAKILADQIRHNRSAMITRMREIDVLMACKCMGIFGLKNFSNDQPQKDFFLGPACESERANLLATIGNVAGASETAGTVNEQMEARLTEIDLGASGISYEKMLLEWLQLRRDGQMDRFVLNAELEEEMSVLSDYIADNGETGKWWQITSMGDKHLYNFRVRWMSGFWAVVVSIVVAPFALALMFTGPGALIGLALFGCIDRMWNNRKDPDPMKGPPSIQYLKTQSEECGGFLCWYKHEKYQLHFNYPTYSKNGCNIKSAANLCVKNIYGSEYLDRPWLLVDIKKPLFVPDTAWADDTDYIGKINTAHEAGVELLSKTNQGGKWWRGDRTHKRNYLSSNYFEQDTKYKTAFSPENGEYKPKMFDPDMEAAFIAGVTKYAKCTEFKNNTVDPLCNVPDGDETEGIDDGDMGYGYLFETDPDIADFAAYTYQHHFHWPSLSADGKIGYPLLTQDAYFQFVEYNLRVIGSRAATGSFGYGQAYELYEQDFNKRKGDYNCGVGDTACAQAKIGEKSSNTKYSKPMFRALALLNFKTGEGLASFEEAVQKGKSDGSFTKGDLAALDAGKAKAMRAAENQKKYNHYKNTAGKTARGKAKMASLDRFKKAFNEPLNKMDMQVGGSNLGSKSSGGSSSDTAKKAKKGPNEAYVPKFKFAAPAVSTYKPAYPQNYAAPRSGHSYKKDAPLNTGLSNTEVNHMLDNIGKGEDLGVNSGDSIFTVVSKAYKRNLSRVLLRESDLPKASDKIEGGVDKSISNEKKDSLKSLLDSH